MTRVGHRLGFAGAQAYALQRVLGTKPDTFRSTSMQQQLLLLACCTPVEHYIQIMYITLLFQGKTPDLLHITHTTTQQHYQDTRGRNKKKKEIFQSEPGQHSSEQHSKQPKQAREVQSCVMTTTNRSLRRSHVRMQQGQQQQ